MRTVCAGLTLCVAGLLAGCGSTTASTHQLNAPRSATSSRQTPSLVVDPSSGLVAGQRVRVTASGFGENVTLSIGECATARVSSCRPQDELTLFTAGHNQVSADFTVWPTARVGRGDPPQTCHQQCVLVATAIKTPTGLLLGPPPTAVAPLTFSVSARPTLDDTSLEDLSWTSATDAWALALQPCPNGTCARMAHTADDGPGNGYRIPRRSCRTDQPTARPVPA